MSFVEKKVAGKNNWGVGVSYLVLPMFTLKLWRFVYSYKSVECMLYPLGFGNGAAESLPDDKPPNDTWLRRHHSTYHNSTKHKMIVCYNQNEWHSA